MAILFDEAKQLFYLHTEHTSYILGLLEGHLVHVYWGKRLNDIPAPAESVLYGSRPQALYTDPERPDLQSDFLPAEYPAYGHADLRTPALHIHYEDGSTISEFHYVSYRIAAGRAKLPGLPHARGNDGTQTLELTLRDPKTGADLVLSYHVFEAEDAITRHAAIYNHGEQTITLERMLSASIDLEGCDYDAVTLRCRSAGALCGKNTPVSQCTSD